MNAGSIVQAEIAPATRSCVLRHPRWVVAWVILAATSAVLCEGLDAFNLKCVGLLSVLYALQGLIAEGLGVRVSTDHISAPRRFLVLPPVVVFWRAKGSLNNIQDITSISKGLERGLVRLKWLSGGGLRLIFSSRDKKLQFFQAVRERRPRVSIYKDARSES